MKDYTYIVTNDGKFHKGVLICSISPIIHDVAWHPMSWLLNLSVGLNQSLIKNLYIVVDNY